MQVLCDSSFLMVMVSKPIKQLEKIESQLGRLDFLVPDAVEGELEKLSENAGPKRSRLAKAALKVARANFRRVLVSPAKYVDDSIIQYAIENKCAVATLDTNLRRRLIAIEVLVLSLSKDSLVIANPKINPKDHL
jgi:rRNA-processing protein FCF1